MYATPGDVFRESVAIRTYSRDVPDEDRKESVPEIFTRVLDAFETLYADKKDVWGPYYDRARWFHLMSEGIALPAGRMLWSMGSTTLAKEGYLPMMNCSFVAINGVSEPFRFMAKMLFLGCGVGFSVERKYFEPLAKEWVALRYPIMPSTRKQAGESRYYPDHKGSVFVVRDSKEGWIDFIVEAIEAGVALRPFIYDLSQIRPEGSRIKGFGGRSGDPQILSTIGMRIYYDVAGPAYPTVSMLYDVACSIGELVVSGNVRRSALIAIGDPTDEEFLSLKKFSNTKGKPWRQFCNNSVNVSTFSDLSDAFWDTYDGSSEAYGFVKVDAAARADEERESNSFRKRYPAMGFNPCGEQPLHNREVCCLAEINVQKIHDNPTMIQAMYMTYLFCKMAFTLGAPTEPETNRIVQANQRIGISLTGISMVDPSIMSMAYQNLNVWLRPFDSRISGQLGVPPCIALTTVKPGGTLPKIAGSSGPGIHRPISHYQIRRVRFSKTCALLPWFKHIGIPVEPAFMLDGSPDPSGTQVASFFLENAEPADGHYSEWQLTDVGLESMFAKIAEVQEHWSDNAISVTVYYDVKRVRDQLIPMIRRWFDQLKVFSGLPYFGHNFLQAPEEPISEERYHAELARFEARGDKPQIPLTPDGLHVTDDLGSCTVGCSDRC